MYNHAINTILYYPHNVVDFIQCSNRKFSGKEDVDKGKIRNVSIYL